MLIHPGLCIATYILRVLARIVCRHLQTYSLPIRPLILRMSATKRAGRLLGEIDVKLKELIACTFGACAIVLMGGSIRPASAQTAVAARSSAAFQRWNSANEISVTDVIHEVVTGHTSGFPIGVNLLLDSAQSFQYASLGSQLNSSIKSELAAGQSIKLKGIVTNINGQNFLVVRELTINQQTTEIRNNKGMLSPRVEASASQGNRPRRNAVNGGAQ
jgi:hypothetical protein